MKINWKNVEFKGEKRVFSNMYPCVIVMDSKLKTKYPMFIFDDEKYFSSEHLYQALKSNSMEYRKIIRETQRPEDTKTIGSRLIKKSETLFTTNETNLIRDDWDKVKIDAMKLSLELKFRSEELKSQLLKTKNEYLEERNDWNDTFWGTYNGIGKNNLGILLMDLRDKLSNFNDQIIEVNQSIVKRYIELLGNTKDFGAEKHSKQHILNMCNKMLKDGFSEDKHSIWLGYIQGVLTVYNIIDVETERNLTRKKFQSVYNSNDIVQKTITA